jgi:hypothetical protein
MKKTLVLGLAIGLVAMASTAFAGASNVRVLPAPGGFVGQKNWGGTGIVGSSHDMSNVAGGDMTAGEGSVGYASAVTASYSRKGDADPLKDKSDKQSRICVYCHHPHNAYSGGDSGTDNRGGRDGVTDAVGSYSPLWNRVTPADGAFAGYSNGIMMAGVTTSDQQHALNASNHNSTAISGVSLLCMSCHDGVTAMNAYSVNTGSDNIQDTNSTTDAQWKDGQHNITSSAGFKGDMNNHHPMGFDYNAVQELDSEIAPAGTTTMVPLLTDVGSIAITPGVKIADLLYGEGTMECVTCHDVHNTGNEQNAERFLWRSNNQSNFCLTCHLK